MKTKNVKCFFAAIAATTLVVGMVAGCGNTVKADEVSKEESSGSKEIVRILQWGLLRAEIQIPGWLH